MTKNQIKCISSMLYKKNINKRILIIVLFIVFTSAETYAQADTIFTNFPVLKGKYFDNEMIGDQPQIFAPFLFNFKTHHIHCSPAFNPEMDELFISVYVNNEMPQQIFYSRKIMGVWEKPKLAPFSGKYQDGGPTLSPDGKTLYFYSRRPDHDGDTEIKESRIWFSINHNDTWSEPQLLNFPKELGIGFYPTHYATDGIFYFNVKVEGREYELYQCFIEENKAMNIKRMDEPFSTLGVIEGGAVTDPTNSILIFTSYNRYGNKLDLLHISKKQKDGSWSTPKIMPDSYNKGNGRFASFTPDSKFLFFSSYRNGDEQIFWVSTKHIFEEIIQD